MRIGGLMMARNEGHKACVVMSYHLERLGFEQFIYIDHDSTDDSIERVNALADGRIQVQETGPCGYEQSLFKNVYTQKLFDLGMDVVIQVDADMMYYWHDRDLEHAVAQNPDGFLVGNWHMMPYRYSPDTLDVRSPWWSEIKHRKPMPMCKKVIMTRAGWNKGYRIQEGDHGVDGTMLPVVDSPVVLEYHAISHTDLVRKTIMNAVGRIQQHGSSWMHGSRNHSIHHVENFRNLMTDGHLWGAWLSERYTFADPNAVQECGLLVDATWKVGR